MKKMTKILLSLFVILSLFLCRALENGIFVKAMNDETYSVPYETYTLGTNSRLVKTQTAFVPVGVITFKYEGEELELSGAQDIFFLDGYFYVANSSAKMVFVSDKNGNVIRIIRRLNYNGETISLSNPTGVFVDDNYIYIADKGNYAVYKVDSEDNVEMMVEKPTSQLYGTDTPFIPIKVAVQSNGTLYIIGEGTTTGVIEVNYAGEFIGFLGINTVSRSFRTIMYNLFFGNEGVASTQPASPLNVALGEKSSVLTINSTQNTETIKRLNIDGINTFTGDTYYPSVTLSDITMSSNNYIYAVSEDGEVFEYDRNGSLLFAFSTKDEAQTQVLGLTSGASGIAVDENDTIYIVDSKYNNVQVYQKTVFVNLVHQAVSLYNEGKYDESKPVWEEIIRQNTSFAKAHSALGMALYKEGYFSEALEEFRLAKDYNGYSDAYWEIRNVFIQENSVTIFAIIIALIALGIANGFLKKKTNFYAPIRKFREKIRENKLVEECTYSFHIIKHPSDTFYGIKRKKMASVLSAVIVLIIFVIVYIVNLYATGFLFKTNQGRQGALMNIVSAVGIILLFVVCNYFISTLNDGEGKLKDIFISTVYSLMPFIIFILPLTLLSHFLTYNEVIIYQIYLFIIVSWCVILLIMSISQIHNYGFWETVKCILLTAFAMIILVLFVLLIYTFLSQLIDFITSVIKEVSYRA